MDSDKVVPVFSAFFPDHKAINHIKFLCDSCKSYTDTVRFKIEKLSSSECQLVIRFTDAESLCMVEIRHHPFRQITKLGDFDTIILIDTLISTFEQVKKDKSHCYLVGYSDRSLAIEYNDKKLNVETCVYRRRWFGKLDAVSFSTDHKPNVEVVFPHQDFDIMTGLLSKQAGNDGGIVDLSVCQRDIRLYLESRMGNDIEFTIETKRTDLTYGVVDPQLEEISISFFLRYARRLHSFFHKYQKTESSFIVHAIDVDGKKKGGILFDINILDHTEVLCWIAHIPKKEQQTYV